MVTEWSLTWTMHRVANPAEVRTFRAQIPAGDDEAALDAAHAMAEAISEASGGAWDGADEVSVERAVVV